tara:strand:- start:2840 stop:4408 length:1569 start_codon:yes stop_codon:yes gene_type:complete
MALTKVSGSILKDPLNLGEVSIGGTLTYEDVTNVDSIGIITARSSIDAQGVISLAESIVHTGDTNTKISFPANDEISFDTSGHDRIYIKSDGKIGMGTVTPATDIHHFADGLVGNSFRLENREGYVSFGNDANGLYIDADSHYFRSKTGSLYANIDSSGRLRVANTNFSASGDGDTAIFGSTSGTRGLTIVSGNNNTGNIFFGDDGDNDIGGVVYNHNGNTLNFRANGLTRATVGATFFYVDDGTNGRLTLQPDTANVNQILSTTTGFGSYCNLKYQAADHIFQYGGSEKFRITSAGVIQCGTSGVLKAEINNAVSGHQFISQCDNNNNGFEIYQLHGPTTTRNTFAVYANTGSGAAKRNQFSVRGDGKLFKDGNQIYPVIQIYQARISGSVSNSTTGSYQDIKTLVTLTPKKAGSMIHVVCQCQTWNASQSDGSSDAYSRLTHNNGGTTTVFAENDRVQGNFSMDERYRHNPITVEGWFTTTTTNATQIKFQGNQAASMPVAFNWFHSYGGFVTVMEYDIT